MKLLDHSAKVRVAVVGGSIARLFPDVVGSAIVVSDRLLQDGTFTSAPVYQYIEDVCSAQSERLTTEVPGSSQDARHLTGFGCAKVGSVIQRGDFLVGKIAFEDVSQVSKDEKLLRQLFGRFSDVVDMSLRYECSDPGVVIFSRTETEDGTPRRVIVHVAVTRTLCVGDELTDKDGNILTVARIIPEHEMPTFTESPVDVLVHPDAPLCANLHRRGKLQLKRRRCKSTGDRVRMTKCTLHVEDTLTAVGNASQYSLVTQQPLKTGFRSGVVTVNERDLCILACAGFQENVREIFSLKSDALTTRLNACEQLVKNGTVTQFATEPESVKRVQVILRGMCLAPELAPLHGRSCLTLHPVSSDTIRTWSHGEVTNLDMINDRTGSATMGGLYCQRIFGPEQDKECACGECRGVRYRGMACQKCGVELISSRMRRQRFGHINLPVSVFNRLYQQHVIDALNITVADLEEILDTTGATAVSDLLAQRGVDSTGIVIDVLPVIPPAWRPYVQLENGEFRCAGISLLYQLIVTRSKRLATLIEQSVPDVIIRSNRRELQALVDGLFVSRSIAQPPTDREHYPLRGLDQELEDALKCLSSKRIEYVARGVSIPDPELTRGSLGLPYQAAFRLFEPMVIHCLKRNGVVDTIKSARRMIRNSPKCEEVVTAVRQVATGYPLLVITEDKQFATLTCCLVQENSLRLHPDDAADMDHSFNGKRLTVHLPLSKKAKEELSNPRPLSDVASELLNLRVSTLIDNAWNKSSVTLTQLDQLLL